MRLPNSVHASRRWRIHEIVPDFRLEDVWALPTPGGPDDFPRLVRILVSGDPARGSSRVARVLWAIRWKVGGLLGWDDPATGIGSRVPTLRDRLPEDLRVPPRPTSSRRSRSSRYTGTTTSGRPRSPTGPFTAFSTSAGSPTGRAATAASWPCT